MIYQANRTKSRTQWAKLLKDTEYKTFSHPAVCKRGHPALFSVSEGGKCIECVKLKDRKKYAKKLGLTLEQLDQKQEAEQEAKAKRKADEQLAIAVRKFQRQTDRDEQEPTYQAIYSLTNTVTGEAYIGSCSNPSARQASHNWGLLHGKHHVHAINEAVAEHGIDAFKFTVLCMLTDETPRQTRYDIERLYISNWNGPVYNTRMR